MNGDEQIALLDAESDDALFIPREALAKRYTAEQCKGIEDKGETILCMFGYGIPVERIAQLQHVNVRTVNALVAKSAEKVARNRADCAAALHTLGMGWFGLAKAKEHEAKFSELVVAGGIAMQRGNEVGLLGTGLEESKTVEADIVSDVRERVRKKLEALRKTEPPTLEATCQSADLNTTPA